MCLNAYVVILVFLFEIYAASIYHKIKNSTGGSCAMDTVERFYG